MHFTMSLGFVLLLTALYFHQITRINISRLSYIVKRSHFCLGYLEFHMVSNL